MLTQSIIRKISILKILLKKKMLFATTFSQQQMNCSERLIFNNDI